MRKTPKVCFYCKYFEMNTKHEDDFCYYWDCPIGPLVRTNGCDKYEPNLHANNAARSNPEARDNGIHQEK